MTFCGHFEAKSRTKSWSCWVVDIAQTVIGRRSIDSLDMKGASVGWQWTSVTWRMTEIGGSCMDMTQELPSNYVINFNILSTATCFNRRLQLDTTK
jgi:hypothetical protein